jgi:RsiW-degrading membrane proteinase PrsW (M82 family)
MIAAFLWGAIVAVTFSGFANDIWGIAIARLGGAEFAGEWSAALTAPPVEEIYKYLGIVVLYLIARLEFDDLMDGFVYGALIGLGFAVAEDIFYFMFVFGGDVAAVLEGFFVRVIASGLYGHVTFTGIAGIGFAYFVTHRLDKSLAKRLAVAIGLLLLAMAAHFVWNSPFFHSLPILLYGVVKGLPFLIGLVVLLYLARRRENQDLELILVDEVGRPGLLPAELTALTNRRSRRAAAKRVKKAAGGQAEQVLKQLQREQIRLALLASAADTTDDAQLLQQRLLVAGLRGRLWQFPGAAAALGVDEATAAAPPVPEQWAAPFVPHRTIASSGGWAWATPDQTDKRRIPLAPGLQLQIMEDRGGWLLVRTQTGWAGWTGAPYLVAVPGA